MSGDTDLLAVLAEECSTHDPIGLLQRLEERGLAVTVADTYNEAEHTANVAEFAESLKPIWAQGKATREQLISEGWSEEMAEHLASHAVHSLLTVIDNGIEQSHVEELKRIAQEEVPDDDGA